MFEIQFSFDCILLLHFWNHFKYVQIKSQEIFFEKTPLYFHCNEQRKEYVFFSLIWFKFFRKSRIPETRTEQKVDNTIFFFKRVLVEKFCFRVMSEFDYFEIFVIWTVYLIELFCTYKFNKVILSKKRIVRYISEYFNTNQLSDIFSI